MKVLLVGYGKMGKTIERIALERGHEIAGRIDVHNQHEFDTVTADVAIEFSHPDAAFNNVKRCLERKIPVVCGTTGWLARKPEIEALTKNINGAFFYASNYSLGVNIFFKLNEHLARMMGNFGNYHVSMEEIHHTEKKDAPSGTAITLAEGVMKHVKGKRSWVNHDTTAPEEIGIKSLRIAQVPGTHTVRYSSAVDEIEIKHTAHTREGFASGAVMVAEWLRDKKGVLSMDDFLQF
ncbi:4-hydroxy-tetrahydrodipicolinate reductase [Fulvivirgaceae bacterium PWU4]|uniref:4-hydroxy-tetrahydrodipicolinate reductase n=1 Tax=Chryseosolibacter histidini TaxID=2782349 RepID=A0AAP2DNF6_9BACT|nr:4-hydroxy-tetrahydrodipicolinate reductase [Chryseosolibacter histidini]MBT1698312.1 4-hydroxy-tetrahydrodipicolinate reductase [Chryseosolibacter histidini]